MSDSLRDQLLKCGLAANTGKPLRSVRSQDRSRPMRRRKNADDSDIDLARAYALRERSERDERERMQREAEQRARQKKERRRKITQLLEGRALNQAEADIARHFPHRDRIRRIYVSAAQLRRLNAGELGVVQLAGRYLLVDRDIALAAETIDPDALVLLCEATANTDNDVPPDLIW
ncbi:MAG: DUF2058 family protein [Rhodanobacteraceae bacterium]